MDTPREPRFIERTVPICPVCKGLVRRDLGELLANGQRTDGPWRCDLHGETQPIYETYEIPVGDDE